MRQAGIIAAGALYALENNIDRLAEDHRHAQVLADAIRDAEGLGLIDENVDTNIVIFAVNSRPHGADAFVELLEQNGILALTTSSETVRLVTHLDVSAAEIETAADRIRSLAAEFAKASAKAGGQEPAVS